MPTRSSSAQPGTVEIAPSAIHKRNRDAVTSPIFSARIERLRGRVEAVSAPAEAGAKFQV